MNTKPLIQAGIALILLRVVAFTHRESNGPGQDPLLAIGSLPARFAISRIMPLPPLVAGLVLPSGILVTVVGVKNSS